MKTCPPKAHSSSSGLWFKPFGFPVAIRCDPGTNYGLHFKQYAERRGIWLEFIPAKAHWRIGLIERRNSVLRDIMERIIDSESIFATEDFDQAIESATHAMNSMTQPYGRPPYMAVFGQIPRVGAGLLQEETALVCPGPDRRHPTRCPESRSHQSSCRHQHIPGTPESTTPEDQRNDAPELRVLALAGPQGQITKKKGAWIVARFLSYDPDNKSAWVHSGTTTVHVALEQLRGAVGFEHF